MPQPLTTSLGLLNPRPSEFNAFSYGRFLTSLLYRLIQVKQNLPLKHLKTEKQLLYHPDSHLKENYAIYQSPLSSWKILPNIYYLSNLIPPPNDTDLVSKKLQQDLTTFVESLSLSQSPVVLVKDYIKVEVDALAKRQIYFFHPYSIDDSLATFERLKLGAVAHYLNTGDIITRLNIYNPLLNNLKVIRLRSSDYIDLVETARERSLISPFAETSPTMWQRLCNWLL